MTAWVVRAGRHGEDEEWNLKQGRAGGGWQEVADLSHVTSREQLRRIVSEVFSGSTAGKIRNYTGQLWALREAIQPGDLIVMPRKRGGQLALGICKSGYAYDAHETDRRRRHHIGVEWSAEEVSRSVLKDDLLNTINGAMTIFTASRNNAEARLRAVMEQGTDPGSSGVRSRPILAEVPAAERLELEEAGVLDPEPTATLEAIRDRISTRIVERFSGHKLTALVADVLTALGWVCRVSPPGADGGVDILAGRGPLGLDSPTLVVEVKSELKAVGAPVVRGLSGAVTSNGADQGLLVAWGGVTDPARNEFAQQRTRIAIWDASELLEKIFDVYPQLSDDTRASLPLKMMWVLDDENDLGA